MYSSVRLMFEIFPNLVLLSPTQVFLLSAETDLLVSLITNTTHFTAVTCHPELSPDPPPPLGLSRSHARTHGRRAGHIRATSRRARAPQVQQSRERSVSLVKSSADLRHLRTPGNDCDTHLLNISNERLCRKLVSARDIYGALLSLHMEARSAVLGENISLTRRRIQTLLFTCLTIQSRFFKSNSFSCHRSE